MVLEEMFLESRPFFPGFTKTVVAFSGLGWFAMDRNNFMIAFFSEGNGNTNKIILPKVKGPFSRNHVISYPDLTLFFTLSLGHGRSGYEIMNHVAGFRRLLLGRRKAMWAGKIARGWGRG